MSRHRENYASLTIAERTVVDSVFDNLWAELGKSVHVSDVEAGVQVDAEVLVEAIAAYVVGNRRDALDPPSVKAYMDGWWYVTETGVEYIVPTDGDLDSLGPDDMVMNVLNNHYRHRLTMDDFDEEAHGLCEIAQGLRRYNEVDGFYGA